MKRQSAAISRVPSESASAGWFHANALIRHWLTVWELREHSFHTGAALPVVSEPLRYLSRSVRSLREPAGCPAPRQAPASCCAGWAPLGTDRGSIAAVVGRDMNGYVRIYRSLLQHPLVKQLPAAWFRIWVVILLSVSWRRAKWFDGAREITIEPGQMVTSLEKLADSTSTTVKQVRGAFQYFRAAHMAAITGTRRHTTVTVCNWAKYQDVEDSEGTPDGTLRGNLRAQSGHSEDTVGATSEESKEIQEGKNVRHTPFARVPPPENFTASERFHEFKEIYRKTTRYWVKEDLAAQAWVNYVKPENEAALFAELKLFGDSQFIAEGKQQRPDNWLEEGYHSGWNRTWPPARAQQQRSRQQEAVDGFKTA